ncbi:hypothetical protein [Streptomyces sp. NBC_00893]|uniref:hypothetical protein n=1 Tax=Streptomyces sp. NBC_00893 TaxID=2975862 RepID=UPI002252A4A5|nr:hypothetical protein [Streptomyces sp. NBC_00893]MCX4851647.1 hypothetical protein [Streptomyces sp. NBC_00893]
MGIADRVPANFDRQLQSYTKVLAGMDDRLADPAPQEREAVIPVQRVSEASLQTDLLLAREEIKDLKVERDRLRERVSLVLGAEIDDVQCGELLRRIRELESHNALLAAELAEQAERADRLERRSVELEDEVTAVRRALTRPIRAVPPPAR